MRASSRRGSLSMVNNFEFRRVFGRFEEDERGRYRGAAPRGLPHSQRPQGTGEGVGLPLE